MRGGRRVVGRAQVAGLVRGGGGEHVVRMLEGFLLWMLLVMVALVGVFGGGGEPRLLVVVVMVAVWRGGAGAGAAVLRVD